MVSGCAHSHPPQHLNYRTVKSGSTSGPLVAREKHEVAIGLIEQLVLGFAKFPPKTAVKNISTLDVVGQMLSLEMSVEDRVI